MVNFRTEHRRALSMLLTVLLVLSMMAITTLVPTSVSAADTSKGNVEVSINQGNRISVRKGAAATVQIVCSADGAVFTPDEAGSEDHGLITWDNLDGITADDVDISWNDQHGTMTIKVSSQAKSFKFDLTISKDNSNYVKKTVPVTVSTSGGSGSGSGAGGASGGSTTVSTPTTSGSTTTVTVAPTASTSGTATSATVTATTMNSAVDSAIAAAAKQGTAPLVVVEISTPARAESLKVDMPTASLKTLAAAEDSSLEVSSGLVDVELDHDALAALVDSASGSTISLEYAPVAASALNSAQKDAVGDKTVFDLSLMSGGTAIHDFGDGTIYVSLPYKLQDGENADDLVVYYLDDEGELTACITAYADGEIAFATDHLSMYVIGTKADAEPEAEVAFTDVDANEYYYEAVKWAVANGVTTGTGDGTTFSPNDPCTRAQIVTFLWRAYGEPEVTAEVNFTDIDVNEYYYNAVKWAVANGITTGTGDGTTFSPNEPCTRAQAMTFLYRAEGKPAATGRDFTDVEAGSFYEDAVKWAVAQGVTTGTGDGSTFSPYDTCTRAQIVTFLYRDLATVG